MTLCQGLKVIAHPLVMENTCVKYYLDPAWHWRVMARTRISGMCAQWPWPQRYDLGSRSWHTLGTWTMIVWSIIQKGQVVTELWPRTQSEQTDRLTDGQTDRQTDGHTGWFPYTQTLFTRGGYNKYTCSSGGGGVLQKLTGHHDHRITSNEVVHVTVVSDNYSLSRMLIVLIKARTVY